MSDSSLSELPPPVAPAALPSHGGRWLGRFLALLLVLALAAGAWWLLQRAQSPSGTGPAVSLGRPGGAGGSPGGGGAANAMAATVGVAQAEQGELALSLDALGTVTPVAQVTLRPQVSGVLTEVLFEEGQLVKKDQLLARIDDAPFEQALAQAQAQRQRNTAQLQAARQTLKRYEQLWEQDSIARQDVDTQAALVAQLEASVAADRASEASARINLGYTRITAPVAGRIGLRAIDAGNMVTAGAATGLAVITQMQPIDIRFAVPQDRVPEVRAAQAGGPLQVQALDGVRGQALLTGQFLSLDNVIDSSTGTLQAKARFENADEGLFPNQFVNVRLRLGSQSGVLVPVTALRTGPQGDYVYVVDGQRVAHMRPVQRGGMDADRVLVTEGLQAGETVVTEGGDRVKDGGAVQWPSAEGQGRRAAAAP